MNNPFSGDFIDEFLLSPILQVSVVPVIIITINWDCPLRKECAKCVG